MAANPVCTVLLTTVLSVFVSLQAVHAAPLSRAAAAARQEALEASRSGAANLAFEIATKHRAAFSDLEYYQLQHAAIAQRLRWGYNEMWHLTGPERFGILDTAIGEGWTLLDSLPLQNEYAQVRAGIIDDLIYGLATRGRMGDTIKLFEARLAMGPPPPYVLVAAGDAYAYLEENDRAIQCYEQALAESSPGDIDRPSVRESLFYSYLDRGRVEDAAAQLDLMDKESPMYVERAPLEELPNEDFLRARRLRAQHLLYTGQATSGTTALLGLRHDAPFNAALRNATAEAHIIDAHPRAARDAYRTSLLEMPDDTHALAGLGRVSLILKEYEDADAISSTLSERFPENRSVRNLRREYDIYDSPLLQIDAGGDFGDSGPNVIANREWAIDTRLYSSPIAYNWRIYAQQFTGHADIDDSTKWRIRNAVGVDYRHRDVEASLALSRSTGHSGRFGVNGAFAYTPNDEWTLAVKADTDSNDLPWKAYQQGVHGWDAMVSTRYQPNDRTYFDLAYGFAHYSDSNSRNQVGGTWFQRWHNSPRHAFATWTSLAYSHNGKTDVDYFSPSNDVTGQVTAMYEWRPWRDGQYAFRQRVYGTGGFYKQHGFSTSPLWELRLEQAWDLPNGMFLSYGVGYGRRQYDGDYESRTQVYLSLNIPFVSR